MPCCKPRRSVSKCERIAIILINKGFFEIGGSPYSGESSLQSCKNREDLGKQITAIAGSDHDVCCLYAVISRMNASRWLFGSKQNAKADLVRTFTTPVWPPVCTNRDILAS